MSERCDVSRDTGRVISNRDEDYCSLDRGHSGQHSWEESSAAAATMESMGCTREQAEVILDRVHDRLGGATHDEAVAANPYPKEAG